MNEKERFKNITLYSKIDCEKKKFVNGVNDILSIDICIMVSQELLGTFILNHILVLLFSMCRRQNWDENRLSRVIGY